MTEKPTDFLRIASIVLISVIISVNQNIGFILAIIVILTSVLISVEGIRTFSSRLKPLLFISILLISFNLIFNRGLNLDNRFLAGVKTSAKIACLSLLVFFYSKTTSPAKIINGLFFLPSRARLALTMTFALIPILIEEYRIISLVQVSRGFRKKRLNPVYNILPQVIPLLHRSFKRAEQLSITLYTRGYE